MPRSSNKLLASLADGDLALLEPHLEFVTLGLRKSLEKPNRRIDAVYFPEGGFASVVAIQSSGKEVEVGLIGREGMTGLPIVFGNHRSPHATYIQAAGTGTRMLATELRKAFQTSPSLRDSLLKFAQVFGVQTSHTAICNAQSKLDVRLARWLLMAHDRIGEETMPLTHNAMPNPEDYSPLPAPPTPVTPPTLPPDFPDIPQNPSSELQPPPDPSASPDKVAGTLPEDDDREAALRAVRQVEQ